MKTLLTILLFCLASCTVQRTYHCMCACKDINGNGLTYTPEGLEHTPLTKYRVADVNADSLFFVMPISDNPYKVAAPFTPIDTAIVNSLLRHK